MFSGYPWRILPIRLTIADVVVNVVVLVSSWATVRCRP